MSNKSGYPKQVSFPKEQTMESLVLQQIESQLKDSDIIQKTVESRFVKLVEDVVDEMFRYGEVKKAISDNLKASMSKVIESVDYSQYIVKLDDVLTQLLSSVSVDNNKLLSNFKNLMQPNEMSEISMEDLVNTWKKFVAEEVDTTGMEINDEEGEPEYEPVDVLITVERESSGSWGKIIFSCDKDDKGFGNDKLRYELTTYFQYDDDTRATIYYHNDHQISSIRRINDFEIFLIRLAQWNVKITGIEDNEYEDEVIPETKPEVTYR